MVVDQLARPSAKIQNLTNPPASDALPGTFPGQKQTLAHVFRVKM
jgi:hypothetical protein